MSENPKLVDAFTKAREAGLSDEQIKNDALAAGWSTPEIDLAFTTLPKKEVLPVETLTPVTVMPTIEQVAVARPQAVLQNNVNVQANVSQAAPSKSMKGIVVTTILLFFLITALGAYAYYADINPFAKAPYREDNLMSGLLERISQIDSASYSAKFELFATEREEGAVPFDTKKKDNTELKAQYARDAQRFDLVRDMITAVKYGNDFTSMSDMKEQINDEDVLGKSITYTESAGGDDFTMTVTFETSDAIAAIKKSEDMAKRFESAYEPAKISGKTVVFTKDSYMYSYFSPEPPMTFFETMALYSQYLPPDLKINGMMDVAVGKDENQKNTDWKINLSSDADFGDLTYKINIDALKKATDYYVRINNLPSLFLSMLPPKGQWVKINSDDTASSTDSGLSILPSTDDLGEYEESYKKNKAEMVEFLKKATEIADEEKIFIFKNKPFKEDFNGVTAYRYDLKTRKEGVLTFYTRITEEARKYEALQDSEFVQMSEEYVKFLQSEEYSEMFDYYDQNINLTLWVDSKGFPISVKNSIRIVPPDEIVTLKDRQIMLDLTFGMSNINTPVEIETPADSKPYAEVMKELQAQFERSEPQIF